MNYRHAYHAGNFADVMKHTALVAVLLHLRNKQTPFAVIDTHAGRGFYDLSGGEAQKTGEARQGILRLKDASPGPEALVAYLTIARRFGEHRYPGSPLIAASLLRPQDRLVAIEKHPDEAGILAGVLKPYRRAKVRTGDGYTQLAALLPPPERRGAILIDPPFEAPDEFSAMAQSIGRAILRFANGIYLIWYPVKNRNDADAFGGEILSRGARRLLRLRLRVGAPAEGQLGEAGLLIVNPPYRFDAEMRAALAALAGPLGMDHPATWTVEWLAGEG